eukprot:m.68643 g.68643  ORF g.68643 m.68643 type:complete len:236 (-) comp23979_c1_seq1:50-757(-)
MPLPKGPPPAEQQWKKAQKKAMREGTLKTVYEMNGEKYTGDWHLDLREGKGTCIQKNGTQYEGDWKAGKREGYGVRSVKRDGVLVKEYSGAFFNNKKEGYGAQFFSNGERYEGEWFEGLRSGWGRMWYLDGSMYDGEWFEGKRAGTGVLMLPTGNRYEGGWKDGEKSGEGKFFFLDKGQVYNAIYVDGIAKCGEFIDLERQHAEAPTQYPIPPLELCEAEHILARAKEAALKMIK